MNPAPRAFGFDFTVGIAHPALPGHFPGNPVVPGALLLAHVLAGVSSELKRTVSAVKHVKFTAALLPDETASVDCEARADELRFAVQATRAGNRVSVASGTLTLGSGAT
jgi:3-hydroxymyristoyl/3-hydroxydecanoyl-(acyl carrier protein) dehydratase